MKHLILLYCLLFSLLMISCRDNPEAGKGPPYNRSKVTTDKTDADFLAAAYKGGLFEIESANHVKNMLSTAAAKDLAVAMITAHNTINDRISNLAKDKNISLPASMDKEQQKKLESLKDHLGASPDKTYAGILVDDHMGAAALFEKASKECKDKDIRGFFEEKSPEIAHHLEMARTVRDNLK
jgi:putative membrane protein